jgi:hypothetical protein
VSTECVQIITVIDETAPIIIACPADATVSCESVPDPATAEVMATDNCDPDVEISYSGEESTQDADGEEDTCDDYSYTLTRTWVAKDACGNVSTECVQIITVIDETAPIIIACPADATVSCESVPDPATADVMATDNCDQDVEISYRGE